MPHCRRTLIFSQVPRPAPFSRGGLGDDQDGEQRWQESHDVGLQKDRSRQAASLCSYQAPSARRYHKAGSAGKHPLIPADVDGS